MRIAFFGSSLVSAYWNGAATYYRGIIRALHERGHQITFYEPDAYERQQHRDIDDPAWAEVVVWQPDARTARRLVEEAGRARARDNWRGGGGGRAEPRDAGSRRRRPGRILWGPDRPAPLPP